MAQMHSPLGTGKFVAGATQGGNARATAAVVATDCDPDLELERLRAQNAALLRQVAALKAREAQMQRFADRDGLTGLYNRRKMQELLQAALAEAPRHAERVGLLFIDLDGFKAVNDVHGHAIGDELLLTVAARIAGRARTGDHVCRYGGDEFVVVLPRVADLSAALQVARSIEQRVSLPYRVGGLDLSLSAAVGVSLYPDQARSAEDMLRRADESMYRVKTARTRSGRPRPRDELSPARRRDDPGATRALERLAPRP